MAGKRANLVRGAAKTLSDACNTVFKAEFESGTRWHLEWIDGPTPEKIRKRLSKLDVGGADVRMHRSYSTRAIALAAIRSATDGDLLQALRPDWAGGGKWRLESDLDGVDSPEVVRDDRELHMLAALLAAATPPGWKWPDRDQACNLVADRGVGWLIEAAIESGYQAAPLDILTIRYATGDAAASWRAQAKPMSLSAAAEAAAADPDITLQAATALLTVLAKLRAQRLVIEAAAVAAARRCGATWEQIGQAVGVSEQQAQHWAGAGHD